MGWVGLGWVGLGVWGQRPDLKGGLGGKAPSFGNVCSYIAYAPHPKPAFPKDPSRLSSDFNDLILPTQNPRIPPVVPLDFWVVLRDYLVLIYLVLWFFTLFWVIFYVKTAKIETELSPTFRPTGFYHGLQ